MSRVLLVFLLYDAIVARPMTHHAVQYAVSLIVYIINAIAVNLGTGIDDLTRANPLLIILLLANEVFHVLDLGEVVHFKSILRVNFLQSMS